MPPPQVPNHRSPAASWAKPPTQISGRPSAPVNVCQVPLDEPGPTLAAALHALGQPLPDSLSKAPVQDIWRWADQHRDEDVLSGVTEIAEDGNAIAQPENGLL